MCRSEPAFCAVRPGRGGLFPSERGRPWIPRGRWSWLIPRSRCRRLAPSSAGLSVPTPNLFSSILDPISQAFERASVVSLAAGLAGAGGAKAARDAAQPAAVGTAGLFLDLAPRRGAFAPGPGERAGWWRQAGGRGGPAPEPGACPAATAPAPRRSACDASLGEDSAAGGGGGAGLGAGSPAAAAAPSASGWGRCDSGDGHRAPGRRCFGARAAPSSTWSARSPARSSCGHARGAREGGAHLLRVPDLRLAAESQSAIENLKLQLASCGKAIWRPACASSKGAGCQPPAAEARQGLSGTLQLQGGAGSRWPARWAVVGWR